MAQKPKVKYTNGAFYRLRSEPGVQSALERWAERFADEANRAYGGNGYKTSSVQGKRRPKGRWRTTVITADAEAMLDNAKNDTLLRVLGGTTGISFSSKSD